VLLRQQPQGETARHRGVLDRLNLGRLRRCTPFKLGEDQAAIGVKAEDIETVLGLCLCRLPFVELKGDDHDVRAQHRRIGDDPFLQVCPLRPCDR
jgi:hypothetical protein